MRKSGLQDHVLINQIQATKEEIEKVQYQIEQAKRNYDLNKAAELEFGKLDNLFLVVLALIFIIIASASTNLIVNFIPSQYTLVNFLPFSLSIRSAGLIISILGFIIGIFWLTFLSQVGALSFIDTFGAFFGPLFGIMISDFYFIQKSKINNKDIYSLENNGIYYYTGGWHIKAVYSVIIGFIFSASTIWNANLMFLQSFSWIIGAAIAAFTYYLLARE